MKRMIKGAGKAVGLSLIAFACLLEPGHGRLVVVTGVAGICLSLFCVYHDMVEETRTENARRSKLRRQVRY